MYGQGTGAASARGRWGADRGLAIIRLLGLPVIFFGERFVEAPEQVSGPFPYVFAAAALYAVGALGLSYSPYRGAITPAFYVGLDLVFICGLALASGGETSEARRALFLPPLAAAFLLRPWQMVLAGVAAISGYVLVGALEPPIGVLEVPDFVAVQAAYIAWFAVAATILCWTLTLRARRIEQLDRERGRLVAKHSRRRSGSAGGFQRHSTTRRCRTCSPYGSTSTKRRTVSRSASTASVG